MASRRRKHFFSIIFIPDQERNPKSMSMSYHAGKLLLILFGILTIHMILGGFGYLKLFSVSRECNQLKIENSDLIRQNKKINKIADDHMKNKMIIERILKAYGVTLGVDSEDADLLDTGFVQNRTIIPSTETGRQIKAMNMNVPIQNRLPYLVTDRGGVYNPENIPTLLPVEGYLTTRFQNGGWMLSKRHLGIDLAANRGTPIRAAGSGIVVFADWTPDFGNLVILSHKNGYHTYYAHASHINVSVGTSVERGNVIALLGSSGASSAPHLHFEIWRDGKPIDPEEIIYSIQKQSKSDT